MVIKLFLAALLTATVILPAGAEDNDNAGPDILIETMRHDFGEILERKVYRHVYIVKNVGTKDLIIQEVKPGCGCTAASFTEVIRPGEVGEVVLEVDNEKVAGKFDKSASILTNDPKSPQMSISIAATIVPFIGTRPEGRVYLRGLYGEKVAKELEVFSNETDHEFEITGVRSNIDDKITYRLEKSGEPGRYVLKMWKNPLLPTMNTWGNLYIETNSENAPEKIIQVNVTTRGVIVVQPSTINFGRVEKFSVGSPAGEELERTVTVFKVKGGFNITKVEFSSEYYEAEIEALEEGKYRLTVRMRPGDRESYQDEMIINTDDPNEPSLRVRLLARAI